MKYALRLTSLQAEAKEDKDITAPLLYALCSMQHSLILGIDFTFSGLYIYLQVMI